MDNLDPSRIEFDSRSPMGSNSPVASGRGEGGSLDGPSSMEDIEECLKLLDEVWPPDGGACDEIPRQLGRFTILRELGRGGFGVVFLAEDSLLGRRVAIKVPRVEILAGSETWRRFLREARAASRLDHPNLVPLLEAGAVGPVGYIVSAYVPGPSLERWLAIRAEPAEPRWSARLIAALARAIDHVHGQGILHRDLKPANVLLQAPSSGIDPSDPSSWRGVPPESWVPRICDFGLAKLHEIEEEETRSRIVCGSPPYMAPEQADSRRDEIGPATDVYGLGAILYELLTGRPPFGGPSNLETLRRVVTEEPVPPRRRRSGIPRDLETICLKCLNKCPEGRYATAAGLAEDIERFLEGRPITARPTPTWERTGRWMRRNPTTAVLLAFAILAVSSGIGGLVWHDSVLRVKNEELRREAHRAESEALRAERQAQEAEAQRRLADRQSRLLRRQLAGSQIFQAQQAVSSGRFERARRLLEFAAPEFGPAGTPTFVWRFLEASVGDHIEVLTGHEGMVDDLAISPDGRSLASGDDRGEIRIWDLDTGRCRLSLTGSLRAIGRLAWSPDGTMIASAGRETGEIRIWEVSTGRFLGRLEGTGAGEPVWVLAFERDGRGISAAGPRREQGLPSTRRWDISRSSDGFPEVPLPDGAAGPGKHADERLQYLVDLLDRVEPSASPRARAAPRRAGIPSALDLAFTRDRELGVVARDGDVFDVFRNRSWTQLATVCLGPARNLVVLVAPKIGRGASPPSERNRVERLADGLAPGWRQSPPSTGTTGQVYAGWSNVSGPNAGELVIWHEIHKRLGRVPLDSGHEVRVSELGPLNGVQATALGPGGATIAVGTEDHQVRIWHRRPSRRTISTSGHSPAEAWAVAFSPDGRTLASGGDDHLVRLWDATTGLEKAKLRKHESLVTSVAFSPDGRTLASGSFNDKTRVILWDLESGVPRRILQGHRDRVRSVAFSPDGRILAAGGDEDAILLWNPRDGGRNASIALSQRRGPSHMTFSPDGRTIAVGGRDGFSLVDVSTRPLRPTPIGEEVGPVVFSRDGSLLIVGLRDGSIHTWDLHERREIRKVQGHAGLVLDLALSSDGAILASAGEDGTVRLWDFATGQELLCLTDCAARVNSVAFSPDDLTLAAADHSGAITIWDAHPRH